MADRQPSVPRNIVIIGGGIIGVCTAYYLVTDPSLPSDTTVTLVEGTRVAAGASGGAGGFLARGEEWFTEATLGISQLGYDLHKQLAAEHDGAEKWGYRALDTYSVTVDESAPPQTSLVPWLPHAISYTQRGTTASTAQVMPDPLVNHLCPVFTSQPRASLVISQAVGLTFSPLLSTSCSALANDAPASRMVTGVEVLSSTDDATKRVIPADAVVLAAGPWLGDLATKLLGKELGSGLNVWGAQANSIILRTKEPLTAQAVFAKIMMGGEEAENEPEVYCRPDGTTYFCGTAGLDPLPSSASSVPICQTALSKLHAEARALSPVFRAENGATVVKEQACFLPKPERGRPLVGKVRGVEGVWVGGGWVSPFLRHVGDPKVEGQVELRKGSTWISDGREGMLIKRHDVWGIVQGPGTGLVLSEMLLGKPLSADVSLLAP